MTELVNLYSKDTTLCKVSSVLNRNKKEYGLQNMFDGDNNTCWNSDEGSPQFILLQFLNSNVDIKKLSFMFQGGFVGQDVQVFTSECGKSYTLNSEFDPEESNSLQSFSITAQHIRFLKIVFPRSTDFYGRITIYRLDILGNESLC